MLSDLKELRPHLFTNDLPGTTKFTELIYSFIEPSAEASTSESSTSISNVHVQAEVAPEVNAHTDAAPPTPAQRKVKIEQRALKHAHLLQRSPGRI